MKTVYKPEMVAHLWANQSQPTARNAGGTLYFQTDTIYSYGDHFPIARIVTNKGKRAVLFTTRGYSMSTARHKRIVERACNVPVFRVSDPTTLDVVASYRARYADLVAEWGKAKGRKPAILESIVALVGEANGWCEFAGEKARFTAPTNMEAESRKIARANKARDTRARNAREKREREETEKRRATWEKDIKKWLRGGCVNMTYHYGFPVRLRVKGDNVETSAGAEFPVDHGVKAYRILKRMRDSGQTYQSNGHTIHLGHFALDSFDGQTVKAGCHSIEWAEIERLARLVLRKVAA